MHQVLEAFSPIDHCKSTTQFYRSLLEESPFSFCPCFHSKYTCLGLNPSPPWGSSGTFQLPTHPSPLLSFWLFHTHAESCPQLWGQAYSLTADSRNLKSFSSLVQAPGCLVNGTSAFILLSGWEFSIHLLFESSNASTFVNRQAPSSLYFCLQAEFLLGYPILQREGLELPTDTFFSDQTLLWWRSVLWTSEWMPRFL